MVADVTASNALPISSTGAFEITAGTVVDTDSKDVASTLTVLVENAENTYTVTKEVAYSDAAPKATSLVAKYDDVNITAGLIQAPIAELNKDIVPTAGTLSKLQFVAKDQYGVQRAANAYNVVVTNQGTTGTVNSTGTGSGFIAADAGKSLQLNVRVDGLLQSVKVIAQ